jgi:hypothetical protein
MLTQLRLPLNVPADGWKVHRVGVVANPGRWTQNAAQASGQLA